MLYCLDRTEEGFAVLEDENGGSMTLCAELLAAGAKPGDWGRVEEGVFYPDARITREKRDLNAAKLAALLKRNGE